MKLFTTALTTVGLLVACHAVRAEDDKPLDTATPSTSLEQMLQRFVQECVTITPGHGRFPASAQIGEKEPGKSELPRESVQLDGPFEISRYEMTQELYAEVMGRNPSRWKGPRNSVEQVSWPDVQTFCRKLTQILRKHKLITDQQIVRLPTDVEWEYCCRAGSNTRFCFGETAGSEDSTDTLDKYAWHTGNAAGNDPAVGILKANAWGLCDMHGYLWEFVETTRPLKSHSMPENSASQQRMIRGGSWRDRYPLLSSSTYLMIGNQKSNDAIGFRCVIDAEPSPKNSSDE